MNVWIIYSLKRFLFLGDSRLCATPFPYLSIEEHNAKCTFVQVDHHSLISLPYQRRQLENDRN